MGSLCTLTKVVVTRINIWTELHRIIIQVTVGENYMGSRVSN